MSGQLFIVTAPSGAGKTTLLKRLMSDLENLAFSVSHTTRHPRSGEIDGQDYFFTSSEEFLKKRDRGEFLEWACVHDHYYGTSFKAVEDRLAQGIDIVLDIDVAGADQVRAKIKDVISIFIMPPSLKSLGDRLHGRNKDTEVVIQKRLSNAKREVLHFRDFTFTLVNDHLDTCYHNLKSIFETQRFKTLYQLKKIERIIENSF